jgi:cobalt-zinc-cadmium efflux system protein
VSALILVSAWRLLKEVVHVLMEGVPKGVDAAKVSDELAGVEGVHSVHDLHIWSLSSSQRALAAHIEIGQMSDWQTILPRLQALLAERFSITHTTLQPEDRQTAMACAVDSNCGVAT